MEKGLLLNIIAFQVLVASLEGSEELGLSYGGLR
jgi:hypothetical protein